MTPDQSRPPGTEPIVARPNRRGCGFLVAAKVAPSRKTFAPGVKA